MVIKLDVGLSRQVLALFRTGMREPYGKKSSRK